MKSLFVFASITLASALALAKPAQVYNCSTSDRFETTRLSIPTSSSGDANGSVYFSDDGRDVDLQPQDVVQFKNYKGELFLKVYTLPNHSGGLILDTKKGTDGKMAGTLTQFKMDATSEVVPEGKVLKVSCSID